MERLYGDNNSRLYKLMALSGAISPISEQRGCFYHPPWKSPRFDSRANSENLTNLEDLDSPLIRYLRSGSPLSSIENLQISPQSRSPPVFKTPVKVEEDVLVMDGILVGPVTSTRTRSSSSTSDSGGSSSSGGKSFYKTEICRSWEDSGSCRYGAKCQFAHGKEELRPTRFPHKNKSEAQTCKSFSSGSCSYGSKCHFIHHQVNSPTSSIESAVMVPFATTQTTKPIKLEHALSSVDSCSINFCSTDWSPLDDGIEVTLPSSTSTDKAPSREDVDAYIHSVLYCPNQRKKVPVFTEICPRKVCPFLNKPSTFNN